MAGREASSEPHLSLTCAGSYQGKIDVPCSATVGCLRQEILKACGRDTVGIKLIVGGRNLMDDTKTLQEMRVHAASRVLVLRHAEPDARHARELDHAAERERRLKRLKHAVDAMTTREGGDSHRELHLENQSGASVQMDTGDKQALVMGITLHESAKRFIGQGDWAAALRELELAEESFDLCRSDLLASTDNVGLLMLDIVWCLFKLGDVHQLAAAQARLQKARAGLAAAHGPDMQRLRVLHGNFRPELATYVRLQLMEGVCLFLRGDADRAKACLQAAQGLWSQLQVSDDALASLLSMGFKASEAKRGLRFCGGDVGAAAAFVLEQRRQASERRAAERKRRAAVRELEALGRTLHGKKLVDAEALERLTALGFDKPVAAEALRVEENSEEAALDALVDPEQFAALQLQAAGAAQAADARASAEQSLLAMGYRQHYVRQALQNLQQPGDVAAAVQILSAWGAAGKSVHDAGAAQPSVDAAAAAAMLSEAAAGRTQPAAATDAAAADAVPAPLAAAGSGGSGSGAAAAGAPQPPPESEEDEEMETKVASMVKHQDPLSAFDVDVSEEGAVIAEYLAKLEAAAATPAAT